MTTHDIKVQSVLISIDDNILQIKGVDIDDKNPITENFLEIKEEVQKIEVILESMMKQEVTVPMELRESYYNTLETISSGLKVHVAALYSKPIIENISYSKELLYSFSQDIKKVRNSLEKLPLLNELTKDNQLNVIVGANGSGKSSLVDYLKDSMLTNLSIIPAYRSLFFISDQHSSALLRSTSLNIRSILQRTRAKVQERDADTFSIAIYALVNEYVEYLSKKNEDETYRGNDILEKLNSIYLDILPHIRFSPNTKDRILIPHSQTSKEQYKINELSDGEKSALYFISLLLLIDKKSYIVVDEPETYMHTALAIKLWNRLLREKADCKFILISHNIDFIQSLTGARIKWLKKYERPKSWEFQNIEGIELPQDLVLKIMGSKKDVLFIEGKSHASLDYRIYSELFGEIYNIQPVEGHREVKKYTEAYNRTNIFGNSAKGIIDRDSWEDEEIQVFEEKKVYVLPTNEIEMLLFTDEVMEAVLIASYYGEGEVEEMINQFKKYFFERINTRKEQIIMNHLKNKIDHYLEKQKIEDSKTLEGLKKSFANLIDISVDEEYDKLSLKIDTIIAHQDYKIALEICNLKREITKDLANKHLVKGYLDFAERLIKNDIELKNKLKEKYFGNMEREIPQVLESV
ncbi:AAA family ATPase [Listeria booriae]|uniref:AAA family ATPase n=1 Tax=Listeria booriae TaxID=1552123 RepID=UPI001628D423|nr:AAA family ATPase [Listeria booriae]MBC2148860.1 AAA family ATPase [Listeria booriae]